MSGRIFVSRLKLHSVISSTERSLSIGDSGRLVPKVRHRRGGASYRLDQQECHGIKELVVLLTHLYNDKHQNLIIDEPELNLHPQYQAILHAGGSQIRGAIPK